MIQKLLSLLSLQVFQVSRKRKALFAGKIIVLGVLLYFEDQPFFDERFFREVLWLVVVGLVASVLANIARFWLVTRYRQKTLKQYGERDNFIIGMDRATTLFVLLAVAGSIFPIFDIPFTRFLTSLSLFSVAFAWVFKEYLTNFFDSFRLMFSSDFLIGDYIKLSDTSKGVITDITFRATKVKTDEGDVLFIPNTTLMNTEVTNYSKVKYKRIIVPFVIATEQLRDLERFETHIADSLVAAFPELVQRKNIFFRIVGIDNGHSRCASEVAIDAYSFAAEDAIQKCIYRTVVSVTASSTVAAT